MSDEEISKAAIKALVSLLVTPNINDVTRLEAAKALLAYLNSKGALV